MIPSFLNKIKIPENTRFYVEPVLDERTLVKLELTSCILDLIIIRVNLSIVNKDNFLLIKVVLII